MRKPRIVWLARFKPWPTKRCRLFGLALSTSVPSGSCFSSVPVFLTVCFGTVRSQPVLVVSFRRWSSRWRCVTNSNRVANSNPHVQKKIVKFAVAFTYRRRHSPPLPNFNVAASLSATRPIKISNIEIGEGGYWNGDDDGWNQTQILQSFFAHEWPNS